MFRCFQRENIQECPTGAKATIVHRRNFLQLGGMALAHAGMARLPAGAQVESFQSPTPDGKADHTLRIGPVTVELDRSHIVSTIGYNNSAPGPVLRMREGKPVTVDVINDTDTPELVHWHGMLISPEVDGTEEEGSPLVPPRGRRRFQFIPRPAGSRWYHSHAMAMADLHKGAYTGQFGFVYVEGAADPGQYDQELFLALRDWEPFFTATMDDEDDDTHDGPLLEKPATLNTDPDGLEVGSIIYSINDKALGSGDPIRVREGQRLLVHFLNASAIENRRIALAGHKMKVIALDGNPVPTPQTLDSVFLGAGERIDVVVDMNNPGVWILGSANEEERKMGMGVVVEYADKSGEPQWQQPSGIVRGPWDYSMFGSGGTAPEPDHTFEMKFEKIPGHKVDFNHWTINGKSFPDIEKLRLEKGKRYKLFFDNKDTGDIHPLHLHRHTFEVTEVAGKPMAGLMKDVVSVGSRNTVAVTFVADNPGLTLFHCHMQLHQDFGFMQLLEYASS